MKCKYGEINDVADLKWLLFEGRIDFGITIFAFNWLNKKNMPEDLELKFAEQNWTLRKNSLALMHQRRTVYVNSLSQRNQHNS